MIVMNGLACAILAEPPWCVHCGGGPCQVDHVKALHAGGLTEPINLLPLCPPCNSTKSCYWPGHGYHPLPGFENEPLAKEILRSELDWLLRYFPEALLDHELGLDLGYAPWPGSWYWGVAA